MAATDADPNTPDANEDTVVRKPGFVYRLGHVLLLPIARLAFRPTVTGRKNVPKHGPVILASNHLSAVDSLVIPVLAPRRVQFLTKANYFNQPGIKGAVQRWFFYSIGAVPVKRGAGQAAQDALNASKSILDAGSVVALYPEGTRSLDGRLYRGRTGIGWLALTTGAVVVPVGLIGTQDVQPVGSSRPRIRRFSIAFGEPLDLSAHGPATSGRARRKATDEVMAAIVRLSGQEVVEGYNEVPPAGTVERIKRALRPEQL